MSAKREKRIRRTARNAYKYNLYCWERSKPPLWRIFRYLKWKKQKPVYEYIEKKIKRTAKARGNK